MEKLIKIESTCVPVNIENVDTDQIIPARFLKATSREGFGDNLFRDWRYDKEGNPNAIHAAVEALMTDLTLSVGIPIHLQPEQYTTQEAVRLQGRNDKVDASAAAIILNSYITQQ